MDLFSTLYTIIIFALLILEDMIEQIHRKLFSRCCKPSYEFLSFQVIVGVKEKLKTFISCRNL